VKPNRAAAKLLQNKDFQKRARKIGVECAATADDLLIAAGNAGGILSLSPPKNAAQVKHPTKFGIASSNQHQVYTDGEFVFDPLFMDIPVSRAEYEAEIARLNGPTVAISFFSAQQ
jgi:hypothetical protein